MAEEKPMIDRSRLSIQLNVMNIAMKQYIEDLLGETCGDLERKIRILDFEKDKGGTREILKAVLDFKRGGKRKFKLMPWRSENGHWNGYYMVLDKTDNSLISTFFDPNWRNA